MREEVAAQSELRLPQSASGACPPSPQPTPHSQPIAQPQLAPTASPNGPMPASQPSLKAPSLLASIPPPQGLGLAASASNIPGASGTLAAASQLASSRVQAGGQGGAAGRPVGHAVAPAASRHSAAVQCATALLASTSNRLEKKNKELSEGVRRKQATAPVPGSVAGPGPNTGAGTSAGARSGAGAGSSAGARAGTRAGSGVGVGAGGVTEGVTGPAAAQFASPRAQPFAPVLTTAKPPVPVRPPEVTPEVSRPLAPSASARSNRPAVDERVGGTPNSEDDLAAAARVADELMSQLANL